MEDRDSLRTRLEPASRVDPDLEQVRDLLFGRERAQLARLQRRLDDPEQQAAAVSRILPAAVRLSLKSSDHLAVELREPVEKALSESVRRRPEILTSVIFPVIGPATRRAVSEALSRLVQSINAALDRSLSPRAIAWRFEAWRTGRSYAEIVLYHTLVYRVEEVLLIHRPSGILLHHLAAPGAPIREAEVVSSMLTAIQDFVVDCFRDDSGGQIQSLEIESLTVWVETGPAASLAAVIRGHPPCHARETLQRALERIHEEFGDILTSSAELERLNGRAESILEECLTSEFRKPAHSTPIRKGFIAALAVVLLMWFVVQGGWLLQQNRRWDAYLKRLAAEEGIVVTDSRASMGRFRIAGWRDPLAVDPAELLREFNLPRHRVTESWESYQAITPGLVIQRATRILNPPEGVTLRFTNGVLSLDGNVPATWIASVRHRAESIPGVLEVDVGTVSAASDALDDALRKISSETIQFGEDTRLVPGQEEELDALAADIRAAAAEAERAGLRLEILLTGHTDKKGTPELNHRLSYERAWEARQQLQARGVPPELMEVAGVGSTQPLRPGMSPDEEHQNRRVTFRVVTKTQ